VKAADASAEEKRAAHAVAVLRAHNRYAIALVALDEYRKQEAALVSELESAESEWRALARKAPR
jgi:hypothetical protein